MNVSSIIQPLKDALGNSLPDILVALAILIGGWLVAMIARAVVRKGLGLIKLNERVRSESGGKMDLEGGISKGVFFLILLWVIVLFFNRLNLSLVSAPIQALLQQIGAYVPNLIAGGALIAVAWILATVLRKVVNKGLASTGLDEKLTTEAGTRPMSQNLGNIVYGLVLLLFLPGVLSALGIEGLIEPVRDMVDKILAMLPNVFAAAVLGFVGWFVAGLLRNLVASLLEAVGTDRFGEQVGLKGTMTLSKLAGLIVFVFVFVPALIAALNALKIEAISAPATQVLGTFMGSVPNVLAAAVILAIAFFVADLVGKLVSNLLGGVGFDRLPEKLGIGAIMPAGKTPSSVVGTVVVFFIVLFATVEAANVLGFTQVSEIVDTFIRFGGQVLLGVVIIAVGMWIANLAYDAIRRLKGDQSGFVAPLVRFTILGVVFAMGLRAMDLANEIVNAAFYLTLGAVAVAVALSFGLGGREAAGKQMEHWLSRLRRQ